MATGGAGGGGDAAPLPSPARQFYRRPLPPPSVDFSSDEGKAVFKAAMEEDGLGAYFVLAAHFRTQDEPAYCGLSTLVMCLNALSIDPGRVWKGPWRWFHESMLDCCSPLDVVQKQGISLTQFVCLARCNSATANPTLASDVSVAHFREVVRECTSRDGQVLVVNYSRAVLGQTGSGHFSPIGAYCPSQDMVLVLDVARFKLPPHWVPLPAMHAAMLDADTSSGASRGYCVLSRLDTPPAVLLRLSRYVSASARSAEDVAAALSSSLRGWCVPPPDAVDDAYVTHAAKGLVERLSAARGVCCPEDRVVDQPLSEAHQAAARDVVQALGRLPLAEPVRAALREASPGGLCTCLMDTSPAGDVDACCGTAPSPPPPAVAADPCCTPVATAPVVVGTQEVVCALVLVFARLLPDGHAFRVWCRDVEAGAGACVGPEVDHVARQLQAVFGLKALQAEGAPTPDGK